MKAEQLTTERLVLRRMTMADVPPLHAILGDPEAMRYWSTLPHRTEAETAAWVSSTIEAVAGGEADDFVMTLAQTGAVIGKAGLWRGNELGILVARAHWVQGYALEAISAVIARAFAAGVLRIDADVDPRNQASLNLLHRLGFRKTGEAKATYQIGESWADSVYLSLTAPGYGT